MNNWYVERRATDAGMTPLAHDLAWHMQVRHSVGKAVVIADEPLVLLRVVRKEWLKMVRSVQRERASTLDGALIRQLTQDLAAVENMCFVAGLPHMRPEAHAFFVQPQFIYDFPESVRTFYICTKLPDDFEPERLVGRASGDCVLVDYTS